MAHKYDSAAGSPPYSIAMVNTNRATANALNHNTTSFEVPHQNGGIGLNGGASMVSTSDGIRGEFRGGDENRMVEDGDCMLIEENAGRTASK